MKKLILLFALLIFALGFGQTPITDANFEAAITNCLATNPVDGLCSESEYGAMPDWDVSQVTDMSNALRDRNDFNADISAWDVSNVADMGYMFRNASSFNQPIGDWNVTSVTTMYGMFRNASSFNQPIGAWDVSNVTNIRIMFAGASSFNQPIGDWNVTSVTTMYGMFYRTGAFNQPIDIWDVSSVTDMGYMFEEANAFNQDIGAWDVGNVVDMSGMFEEANAFNQDIGAWDVGNVTNMTRMFDSSPLSTSNYDAILNSWSQQSLQQGVPFGASNVKFCDAGIAKQSIIDNYGWTISDSGINFEAGCSTPLTDATFQDAINTCLSTDLDGVGMCSDSEYGPMANWDVSQVTNMAYAFNNGYDFNGDISQWDVSSVTDMSYMFSGSFNGDISQWDVSNVTNMKRMLSGAYFFNGDISQWDVSSVTNMDYMFGGAFNGDISQWDVSSVTSMHAMFSFGAFNGDISQWDVGNVVDMSGMFAVTSSFNQDISNWDVSSVTDMNGMFAGTSSFNQDISAWDVGNVSDMSSMFEEANAFNQDIGAWDVGNVVDMSGMFNGTSSFNQPIGDWNVTSVTTMGYMFRNASSFNQDIGAWDVSSVAYMNQMFEEANAFNQDIGAWDVSSVAYMGYMFKEANAFNQDIGAWDVGNVVDMSGMFLSATSFNQDISSWCVSNIITEPSEFSINSLLTESNKPIWGTCPTTITDANFNQAIETCLSTNPIDGMCVDSDYGPMANWDVSQVTNMAYAFNNGYDFNGDISQWDVSSVTDMNGMFAGTSSFNQDISAWDVGNVVDMSGMFYNAASFNQDISNWCVTNITSEPSDFSDFSPLIESYKPVWGTCPSTTYEWINYGTQDWTVENAEMVTYRDGTPIPQVTDATEWANLTTGAWCYYDNDPTKGKLYNWYAVAGIHDNDPNTPNKELAPVGWHVPSVGEWSTIGNYLITNGYNFDGTTTGNKIAKSMSSTAGWAGSTIEGSPGNNQLENNSSGFNSLPVGYGGGDYFEGYDSMSFFWTSEFFHSDAAHYKFLKNFQEALNGSATSCKTGMSVRFVRDATSLSTTDFSNSIIMYPNPVKNKLTIDGLVVKDIVIYSVLGKAVLNISNQNTIDVSSLSKGVYFIKVSDGINASTKKFIKE